MAADYTEYLVRLATGHCRLLLGNPARLRRTRSGVRASIPENESRLREVYGVRVRKISLGIVGCTKNSGDAWWTEEGGFGESELGTAISYERVPNIAERIWPNNSESINITVSDIDSPHFNARQRFQENLALIPAWPRNHGFQNGSVSSHCSLSFRSPAAPWTCCSDHCLRTSRAL
jgi:hypothetical protein